MESMAEITFLTVSEGSELMIFACSTDTEKMEITTRLMT
jgi:hypothetical protein